MAAGKGFCKETAKRQKMHIEFKANGVPPVVPHVERVVYRIIDDKTIDLEIVWKNGKSEESEKYALTRLDPEKHVGN